MKNTFGNTPAADNLDDMLDNKYPDKKSAVSRLMHKFNARFSNIQSELVYDRQYISKLILNDFTETMQKSKLPTELKSFMRNLMVINHRKVCMYDKLT